MSAPLIDLDSGTRPATAAERAALPFVGPVPTHHAEEARKRILYVDDEPAVRSFGEEVLSRRGYSVDTAADGVQAWAALNHQEYQLLITDNDMPGMTGLELITQARRAGMRLHIVIASGSVDALGDRCSVAPGLTVRLSKPFGAEALNEIVDRLLRLQVSPRPMLGSGI